MMEFRLIFKNSRIVRIAMQEDTALSLYRRQKSG